MNWVDTPLLVYAAVLDHPARPNVENLLSQNACGSSVLVMLELYQVLVGSYVVAPQDAIARVEQLTRTPLTWLSLNERQGITLLNNRRRHRIDAADAHLLQLAQDDGGTLVSLDRRLLREARAQGVAVHNPIGPALASRIARWEGEHLPAKGLGRLLSRTEQWLREQDTRIADRFLTATEQLTRLPV